MLEGEIARRSIYVGILAILALSWMAVSKPLVVATIPPLASIAREVGGDRIDVRTLVPPGSDPHQFALAPEDAELIRRADLVVEVGKEPFLGSFPEISGRILGWEDWISAGVIIRNDNPHYLWLYPDNAKIIARLIARELERIDPSGGDYYRDRLRFFEERIEELKTWIEDYCRDVEGEKVILVGDHLEPIAEAMGLRIELIIMRGESQNPSPEEISKALRIIEERGIAAILASSTQAHGAEGSIARTLSDRTGIPVIFAHPIPASEDYYEDFIKYLVAEIASPLRAELGSRRGGPDLSQVVALASILGMISVIAYIQVREWLLWRS